MRTLLLAACVTLVLAAEADPKAQAKAAWTAAAKAGDAWSCLQLESWARSRKPAIRLGSVLGDSTVVGEPLFAFPSRIDLLADLGDRIVVASGARAYVLAADGRPLQPAVPIQPGWRLAIGWDGRAIMVVEHERERGELQFSATRLTDGERIVSATVPLGPAQSISEGRVVADDASAAAVEVQTQDPATGRVTNTLMLAVAGAKVRPVEFPVGLSGIGRRGAWLMAGERPNLVVQVGDKRRQAVAAAAGPGLLACVSEGRPQLVLADGREAELAGSPAIGQDPDMASIGGWLVLASGEGAKTVSQGDLLGEGAGVEITQPPTLAFWRWTDLAADPASKPVVTMPGHLSIALQFQAALWSWAGTQLDLVDLSGPEIRREVYLKASTRITWVSTSQHCVRVHHEGGRVDLYGPDKSVLWGGTCTRIDVKRRDLALVYRQADGRRAWSLVRLSADAAQRKEIRLDLPAEQEQTVRVSHAAPDLVLARGDRNWWRSLGLDGQAIATEREAGPTAVPAPRCAEWNWFCPVGRFWRDGVRVRSKEDAPADGLLENLALIDAWRVGSTTILLEESGRVLVTGRKRGEWLDLPAVAPADRLALAGTAPVLASGDELRAVAALAPGPKLEQREGLGALIDLPPGAWRVERRWRFTPPRGRQLEWDEERVGWRPLRLRSPEASGLLVVTPAVLIELDPAAAKLFGR